MTITSISLRKLLCLFYAPKNLRISILRDDIRSTVAREGGHRPDGGGDFHGPFWADAKLHVLGRADLRELVAHRVAVNARRRRLYEEMRDGFLDWWEERRRWRNEPLHALEVPPHARLQIEELGCTVKVENIMGLDSGPDFHRLIYPYFAEEPPLEIEAGRLGLWAMATALPHHDPNDLRVLDVIRGRTAAIRDTPLLGTEREAFVDKYSLILREWDRLRREYD